MKRLIVVFLILITVAGMVGCAAAPDAFEPGIMGSAPNGDNEYTSNAYFDFVWMEDEGGYFVYEKDENSNVDVVIPDSYEGKPVVGIGRHAFGAYSKVRTVVIPESIKIIDSQAFNYCDNLESVVFTKLSGLETIKDYAFYNCKTIESITLPASVENIGYRAFSTCPALKQIMIDEDNPYYSSYDGVLYTKDMKTLIAVPPAADKNDDAAEDSVNALYILEGVEVIGKGAFADCSYIERVVIPSSVISIEKGAFMNCTALKEVIIDENSVLEAIGEGAFRDCSLLERMNIPASVKTIERYAFYCDNLLVEFSFSGSIEAWGNITKGEKWDVNTGEYTVSCTDGAVNKSE